MKYPRTALITSIALLIISVVALFWLVQKNNGEIYGIPRSQTSLEEFRRSEQATYSKEYVENLVQLDLEADKAYLLKDEGINDIANSVSVFLIISILIQLGIIILITKKHNQRVDLTREGAQSAVSDVYFPRRSHVTFE